MNANGKMILRSKMSRFKGKYKVSAFVLVRSNRSTKVGALSSETENDIYCGVGGVVGVVTFTPTPLPAVLSWVQTPSIAVLGLFHKARWTYSGRQKLRPEKRVKISGEERKMSCMFCRCVPSHRVVQYK